MRFQISIGGMLGAASAAAALTALVAVPALAQAPKIGDPPEARNMRLVGYNDLQARSAYQPTIHQQGEPLHRLYRPPRRHADVPKPVNPLTGQPEFNGTSIVDVTDPAQPKYLAHIPGLAGNYEEGGAQMVRVCDGKTLPKGDPNKIYMLRVFGGRAHEIWDVTDPAKPALLITIVEGLKDTHKNWWECDTGIAYLVSGVQGWRVRRMTQVYDLSDPRKPVKIRDFGLVGQEPGATGAVPTELHGGDLDRAAGQSHLFRLRHQQGRRAADRRPREAAEGSEGADAGQPALSGDRPARHVAAQRRAHRLSDAADADRGIRQGQGRQGARHRHDRRRVDPSTNARSERGRWCGSST